MRTTASILELRETLAKVNEKFGYQLDFNRLDQKGKWANFTLKTQSKIRGARISASGRNIPKASWHAHGHFFETLFTVNPLAVVRSLDKVITIDGGNWQDYNIGSNFYPIRASETSIF